MPSKITSMLDAALEYAEAGLSVIPLHSVLEDGSCTCGVARCHSPGKHPRTKNGLKDATTDKSTIEKWWSETRWPNASIGGVGGNYLCLDIDAKSGGLKTLDRLVKANSKLPSTAVVETGEYDGERGLHYWFKVPEGVSAATRTGVREGIDIRCQGGYGVLPPSPHSSGVDYSWVAGGISECVECPEWVLDLVPEFVEGEQKWTPDSSFRMAKAVKQFLSGDGTVDMGEQREFLTAAARSVLTTGRSVELTASLLWEGYDGTGGIQNCEWEEDDPWTPEDIYALVSDIFAKPPTSPLEKDFSDEEFPLDDSGNAKRLVASFPDDNVYCCSELEHWLIWDVERERFMRESDAYLKRRHIEIMGLLDEEAMNTRSEGAAKALFGWAKASRMLQRVNASVKMAELICPVSESELDKDPLLFGCQNGIIDLRTGKLRAASTDDLITKCSPAEYDPDCESEVWNDFLIQAVPDSELRDFLQLAAGYSLTGSIEEHKFFYIYGRPATGKSTFLDAFSRILGTYGTVADTSTFMRGANGRSSGAPTEDLARLAGARLVVTHEVEENERLASALVAQFTGGDEVAARFLHSKTFTFHPRFKLWIAANHRARIAGARSGIWRRMMVIPMDEVVPKAKRDPTLPRRLREPEAQSAILAWAVEGAKKWYKLSKKGQEIKPPQAVEQEGEAYQQESDHLFQFAEECIRKTDDPGDRVPKTDVFELYLGWCDKEGRERRVTRQVLSRRLSDMDFTSKNAGYNGKVKPCWIGMQIKGLRVKTKKED